MKIIYMNWGLGNKYESDIRSNEHHSSSSENKARKKLRPVRDLNPYLCGGGLLQISAMTSSQLACKVGR